MKRLIALGIFWGFLFFSVTILAQVPQLINYQGRLTDDKGIPIITATTVRFSLYQGGDAATPGSGTPVYEEDASVTPDGSGVFSHLIGSGTVVFGALDATVFQTADPVFLEITIDPAGANETLLPRKQIVTVGYSFKSELADDADTVDGQDASAFSPVGHNHDPDYVNEGQADSVTSSMIMNGTIVDNDINASANISASKINTTGLDADLLDGKDSLAFVHTTGDDMTGTLSVNTTGALYALYVEEQSSSGPTYGIWAQSDSTDGKGVYGYATATSIDGTTYGVYGRSDSNGTGASGVYGKALGSGVNYGVYGTTASSGDNASGVYGEATATSGRNYGVYGKSNSNIGTGVYGFASATSGGCFGVYGESYSTNGRAIYGWASATSGTTYGLYGRSDSPNGYGVCGYAAATSGNNYGVYGKSNSPSGIGVYGANLFPAMGYAGYFQGNAHVTGNLTVDGDFSVSGAKNCVQPIDNGKKVLLYAMESPEIWFEDFGTAQMVNGQAVVLVEQVFAQTANIEMGYLIFLTPIGECNGLYISRKDKDSFEVRELGDGTSSITIDYRIVAKRRGYEEVRFEEFTEPEQPPAEPNLPIEKK